MPVPDLGQVREWIDIPASDLPDPMLELIIAAELEQQIEYCSVPVGADGLIDQAAYPAELGQALLRRCARSAAARPLPLGSLPVPQTGAGAEFGARYLPRSDAEIERLEGPWRIIAVA